MKRFSDQFGQAPWGSFPHGDPGPSIASMNPAPGERVGSSSPVVIELAGYRAVGGVRLRADYTGRQASEWVWDGRAFVSPFARHSTFARSEDGGTWTLRRSAGWPVVVSAQIAVLATDHEIGRISISFGATA